VPLREELVLGGSPAKELERCHAVTDTEVVARSTPVRWLPVVLVLAAVFISTVIGQYTAWACVSGEEARGSLEADLCDGYAGSFRGLEWWVAVLWPAVAFGASQLIPALRRRSIVVAACLAALGVTFWIATAVVVIDAG
jgi:hypothetical protein